MTIPEIKIKLIQKGLTIAELAREFAHISDANLRSLETMIADTLYGRRYYPNIAKLLEDRLDIKIVRPEHTKPIREQIKKVA